MKIFYKILRQLSYFTEDNSVEDNGCKVASHIKHVCSSIQTAINKTVHLSYQIVYHIIPYLPTAQHAAGGCYVIFINII